MHLASAGFGAAMTVAARLAAATMAVVVLCIAWSSGMVPVNECSLELKVPSGHYAGGAFFDAPPCSWGTLRSRKRRAQTPCNESGNTELGNASQRSYAPDLTLLAAA